MFLRRGPQKLPTGASVSTSHELGIRNLFYNLKTSKKKFESLKTWLEAWAMAVTL